MGYTAWCDASWFPKGKGGFIGFVIIDAQTDEAIAVGKQKQVANGDVKTSFCAEYAALFFLLKTIQELDVSLEETTIYLDAKGVVSSFQYSSKNMPRYIQKAFDGAFLTKAKERVVWIDRKFNIADKIVRDQTIPDGNVLRNFPFSKLLIKEKRNSPNAKTEKCKKEKVKKEKILLKTPVQIPDTHIFIDEYWFNQFHQQVSKQKPRTVTNTLSLLSEKINEGLCIKEQNDALFVYGKLHIWTENNQVVKIHIKETAYVEQYKAFKLQKMG